MDSPPDASADASPPAAAVVRNAATVVALRPAPAGVQVFMLQRSAKSPFMPSTLVFPGGRLDDQDGPPDARASWERAVSRECREEASLDVQGRDLTWFDTWLTPSMESQRRYLARFFLAALTADEGHDARADGHETHAGRWATVAEHLDAWAQGSVDLPPPTVCVLLQLTQWSAQHLDDGPAALAAIVRAAAAVDPSAPILPKVVAGQGGLMIVMPHDPDYDTAPGEALPAPARVHALPRRFVRARDGWRPQ